MSSPISPAHREGNSDAIWRLPRRVLQVMFIGVVLAGAISPARVFPELVEYGFLVDPRTVFGAVLCAVGLLLFAVRGDSVRATPSEWLWYFGFFVVHLWILTSYAWSEEVPWITEMQLTDLSLLMVFVLTFAQLFAGNLQAAVHMILWMSVLVSLPFVALALALFATGSTEAFTAGFAAGAGGIGMSRLFGIASIAVIYFYLNGQRRLPLLLLPVYVAGIMVSGSRAALLALAVTLAFLGLRNKYVRTQSPGSWPRRLFVMFLGLLLLVGMFSTPIGFEILQAFVLSNFLGGAASAGPDGIYLADRDVIFQDALQKFISNPLTGMGIGSYEGPTGEPYPHNLPLMYAVDAGVVPLLVLLAFISVFVIQAMKCRSDWTVIAACLGIFILVASLFAGSYYDARMFWFMALALFINNARGGNSELAGRRLVGLVAYRP